MLVAVATERALLLHSRPSRDRRSAIGDPRSMYPLSYQRRVSLTASATISGSAKLRARWGRGRGGGWEGGGKTRAAFDAAASSHACVLDRAVPYASAWIPSSASLSLSLSLSPLPIRSIINVRSRETRTELRRVAT